MSEWMPRILILLLLGVVFGVPLAMRPGRLHPVASSADQKLVIITPHNEQIRFEFGQAFNRWRQVEGRAPIFFDWRSPGGTSDLRKAVLSQLEASYRRAHHENRPPEPIGYDLFFGGGDYDHDLLATGISIELDGRRVTIPATDPIDIPAKVLAEVYPDPAIGGRLLYREDLRWVGVALSSFGIVYNRQVIEMLGVGEPQTWSDLQDGCYRNWLALADPGHSSSIAVTYNTILRRHGWKEGWNILRRIFANARYFAVNSAKVPVDVSQGEAAAGMCIDFYGRFQAGAIGSEARVGYVDPRHMTATNSDPISIVHMAPHRDLANEFVLWLLSAQAQHLWQAGRGTEHGPIRYELRRMPVRRDLYDSPSEDWVDQVNPFEIASPFPPAMPDFYRAVRTVSQAMAIDVHDDLVAAWRAIQNQPQGQLRQQMVERFHRMPGDLTLHWPDEDLAKHWSSIIHDPENPRYQEVASALQSFSGPLNAMLKNHEATLDARLRWSGFFRANYRRTAQMGRGGKSLAADH